MELSLTPLHACKGQCLGSLKISGLQTVYFLFSLYAIYMVYSVNTQKEIWDSVVQKKL